MSANQADHSRYSFLRPSLALLSVVILLTLFSSTAFGQIAIPLEDLVSGFPKSQDFSFSTFKVVDDQLFLGTDKGLWIAAKNAKQATHVEGTTGFVYSIESVADRVFVGSYDGLWIVGKDGKQATLVESPKGADANPKGKDIQFLLVDDSVFVGSEDGFWIVSKDGKQVSSFENIGIGAYWLKLLGDQVFFVSSDRVWMVSKDGKQVRRIENIRGSSLLERFGDRILVQSPDGAWVVGSDGLAKRFESLDALEISDIELFEGQIFVAGNTGLLTVSKDGMQVTPVENVKDPTSLELVGDQLFVGTDDGLLKVSKDGKQATPINIKGRIGKIWTFEDQVFVDNVDGLWILSRDGKATLYRGENMFGDDFGSVGKYFYHIGGYSKVYQFSLTETIKTDLVPTGWWATAISYLLPSNWLPADRVQVKASYEDENGKDPYDEIIPKESRVFRYAKGDGDAMPPDSKFSTAEQFNYEIGWGNNEVHYWVKDKWENTIERKADYRGVPSQYAFAAFPFVLSVLTVLGCFALAPRVGFCHSAIMNPWLRNYFSLGSVPLLVSVFPSLRRYILRRYANAVNQDKEFTGWKTRFVSPNEDFLPDNFGKKLNSEKRLLLTGQSGIGKTSFFKYLTACYVSESKPPLPPKVFPVYISLTNYGGNSLEDLIYNQLFAYGKITDKQLAPMFLEHGGLLIFFDGVNEVQNVADRQKLSEFVEKYWTSNYICLSSQQSYPEIDNVPKVQLRTLGKEKVGEFIRHRADDIEKAERVIANLTEEDYQLYGVPRDLEFAVAILNQGSDSLPKSRTELYKTVFNSIFTKWRENGQTDAGNILCERTYKMIENRDLAFDTVNNPRFKEITTDLFEQKFLIKREENYSFRHDLIRAFLASEYFYPSWQNLFARLDGKPIDSNWLEMLKFSCEDIADSNEVKGLVFGVLEKSIRKDLVKDLVIWLKTNHPTKCQSWEKDFYAKYGELDFK